MKGISPLIASVLLIAFVIAVGMLVMGWMSTLTRTTTATVTNKTAEAVDCSAAAISIDAVYISGTAASTIVKNTGYYDLALISAQLYNSTGHNFTTTTSLGNLAKGGISTLAFSGTGIGCTQFSRVVVSTNCGGVTDTYTATPKGC